MDSFVPKLGPQGRNDKQPTQTVPEKVPRYKTPKDDVEQKVKFIGKKYISNKVTIDEQEIVEQEPLNVESKPGHFGWTKPELNSGLEVWPTFKPNEYQTSCIGPTVVNSPKSRSEESYLEVSLEQDSSFFIISIIQSMTVTKALNVLNIASTRTLDPRELGAKKLAKQASKIIVKVTVLNNDK